ncbi:hypothetical protein BC628DRAFT_1352204 [Trametes gibbosa]|nr:hypothetical protein BC628DRAFT_1352204 [Trametes gibbosa]
MAHPRHYWRKRMGHGARPSLLGSGPWCINEGHVCGQIIRHHIPPLLNPPQPPFTPSPLSGTVIMFDNVFKKKEEPRYVQLARQARVARQKAYREERKGKRPSTAPESSSTAPAASSAAANHSINYRRSLGDESMFPHRAIPEPLRFSAPDVLEPFAFLPPPAQSQSPPSSARASRTPLNMADSPCPHMMPDHHTPSVELHNPFRSGTSESMTSTGRTESFDSFADTGVPIHRTVRTFRPTQTLADAKHTPQKAAIFTGETTPAHLQVPPTTTSVASDPFTDTHTTAGQSSSFSTGMASTAATQKEPKTSTSRRWSVLRSPKRASHDFLQVKIPTGIMSPVRESRLAFWSKA